MTYRWLVGALVALFFSLQSHSIAHAAEHIGEPPQHECIACDATVIADELPIALPALPVTLLIQRNDTDTNYRDFTSAHYVTPQGRGPPPRAPPHHI